MWEETMFGWSGRILRVNLSNSESYTEDVEAYTRSFIGGKGINLKIMYDEVSPGTSAFDSANLLCFGPGVLTGTLAPSSGRMKVTSVSPHGLLANSGIGGFIGAQIRYAGYDNLVIQGKSDEPVYLHIHDESVEFRDAAHLWGRGTQETQRLIKEEVGDSVEILCIGPAGENLVSFSAILTGMGSAAGRHGLGAIMGSKRLKAIAVQGTRPIHIAKLEEFISACEEAHRWLRESETMQGQAVQGEGDRYTLGLGYEGGCVPLGNWEEENADWDAVPGFDGADEFWNEYGVHQYGCIGCPVNHFHLFHVPGVGTNSAKCAGWGAFTGNVWTNDRKVMFHADHLCNHYGLDVTSTGNAISFLMELYHKGIITERDTEGLAMSRGDEKAIISTIHKIGKQQGFGQLFRNGVLGAAKEIGKGAEECAMVVGGEAIEPYEVRAYKSEALAAALNSGNIGESLTFEYGYFWDPEAVEEFAEATYGTKEAGVPSSYKGKALTIWDYENRMVVCDLLGACGWVFMNWTGGGAETSSLEVPVKLYSLATGRDASEAEMLETAQMCKTLERAFDVRRGKRRKDDTLPKRLFETAVPGGRYKGERLDRVRFDKMLDEYYALRGCDSEGIPTLETFDRFGLSSEGKALWQELEDEGSPVEGAKS
jgi:aldehyde:ferredoxin oxidoreductase